MQSDGPIACRTFLSVVREASQTSTHRASPKQAVTLGANHCNYEFASLKHQ